MENKKSFITLLMDAVKGYAVKGYVFTLGLWSQPHIVL